MDFQRRSCSCQPHSQVAEDGPDHRLPEDGIQLFQSGNKSRTAQLLGIDRKTLRAKIQRYGLLKEETSPGVVASDVPSATGK
jgi:hypothetical protein